MTAVTAERLALLRRTHATMQASPSPPPSPPPPPTPGPVVVDVHKAVESKELREALSGQQYARDHGDLESLALYSQRRLRALREAYPTLGPFGPFPVPKRAP